MSISSRPDRTPSAGLQQWRQSPAGKASLARHAALYQRYNARTRSELGEAMGREESRAATKAMLIGPEWPIPEPHSAQGNPPLFRYSVREIVACLETILAGPLAGSLVGDTYSPEPEDKARREAKTARLRALMQRLDAHSPQELVTKMGAQEAVEALFALLIGPERPIPKPHSLASTQTTSKPA